MIHPSSIVHPDAILGDNVKIGPFCTVGPEVVLADNVELKSHVVVEGVTTIGAGTVVYPFASLGQAPQILKYRGEKSQVVIGANNVIREYVTIQAGSLDGGMLTSVGDNCLLMVGVHLGHDCKVGSGVVIANYVSLAGHVSVGDHATIGGMSGVHQYVRIGAYTMLGGASALDADLIPFGLAIGNRAKLEGLNLVGMKRRGFDKNETLEANKAIQELFATNADMLFAEKVEKLANNYPNNSIVKQIVEFVQADTSRPICAPHSK